MKVVVVLPAYNCAKSLKKTISEIPNEIVDEIVLVDDFSSDDTLKIAKECRKAQQKSWIWCQPKDML